MGASWESASWSECPTGSIPLSTSRGPCPLPGSCGLCRAAYRASCVLESREPTWLWEKTLGKTNTGKAQKSCFGGERVTGSRFPRGVELTESRLEKTSGHRV